MNIILIIKKLIKMKKTFFITLIICILYFCGYVRCIYKAMNCNWEPVGKAEVIYTAAIFTGIGGIVGWFNIEDK